MSSSFRGASAEALATLTDELERAAATQSAAASLADELFAVVAAVRSEATLRRFATDPSIPTEAKAGLVEQVFSGRVGDATLGVLKAAVGRRWTATRDLADALEHLGVVAAVRSAGRDSDRLVDELFAFGELVKHDADLRAALADPGRSVADKSALLDRLLDGKVLPATHTLARQSLAGSHRTVEAALEAYERTAADVHGQGVATVRTARPLGDAESDRLAAALSRQYDRPVHLNVVVDPTLIGGVRVEIGDDVIDGTVASRLDEARRRLAG